MPGGYEWLIIIGVLLLLFGAKKLPDMARSVGQSARVFKGEMKGLKDDEKSKEADKQEPAAPQQVTEAPVVQDTTQAPSPAPQPAERPAAERPAAEATTPTQAPHDRTDVR